MPKPRRITDRRPLPAERKTIQEMFVYKSSSGNKTYQTLLYTDGSTSCDCMGWTRRVQGDGSRTCKHTRLVETSLEVAHMEAVSSKTLLPSRAQTPSQITEGRAFDFSQD